MRSLTQLIHFTGTVGSMDVVVKHPWLMRRGETYYVRAAVPKDIVSAFGKTEVKRSLRTKDPKEARKRIAQEAAAISEEFETFRESQIASVQATASDACVVVQTKMPAKVLKELIDAYYQGVIDDDFEWRADIHQKSVTDDQGFRRGHYIANPTYEW